MFGDRPIPTLYQQGSSRTGFHYIAHGTSTTEVASMLAMQFGHPVSDKTGLTGKYDFDLTYYQTKTSDRKDEETNPWQPLETAIQDQLGLKLASSHGPVQVLVIDHVEKPSTVDGAEVPQPPAPPQAPAVARLINSSTRIGAPPPPHINFSVVSFKPCTGYGSNKADQPQDGDYIAYHCQPVLRVIYFAYLGATDFNFNLTGFPDWVQTDLYEFEAKVAPEDIATWQKMGLNSRRVVMRQVLAEELKLSLHIDKTPKPVYVLSVAKHGPKLKAYTEGEEQKLSNGRVLKGNDMTWMGQVGYFQAYSMGNLVESLSAHLDRQVLDHTGLTGSYDFSFPLPYGSGTAAGAELSDDVASPKAGLSALGLKLEEGKAEVDQLVVDHIERPPTN